MKKYIAIIVCAIISLTALFLPIGTGARSDGKGSGSRTSVTEIGQLSAVMKGASSGKSATYSYTFNEGLNIGRYSLDIADAQANTVQGENTGIYAKEGYVRILSPNTQNPLNKAYVQRVRDLHTGSRDSASYGAFTTGTDYVVFKDFDINSGLVKVEYQTDDGSWTAQGGYSSASDLGLDVQEATKDINVYATATATEPTFTIAKGQLFILEGTENGKKLIKYSEGAGFVDGYISGNDFKSTYVLVKFNDELDLELDNANYDPEANGSTYKSKSWKFFATKYLDKVLAKDFDAEKDTINQELGTNFDKFNQFFSYALSKVDQIRQGDIVRFYKNVNSTINKKYIRAAEVSIYVNGERKLGYVDATELTKVATTVISKSHTSNMDDGNAVTYINGAEVYTHVQLHSTNASGTIAKRSYVDAEFYFNKTKNAQLVKFNSLLFQDKSLTANPADIEFIKGLAIREWMTLEDAKIYLDQSVAATKDFINPLNNLIVKHVDVNGSIKWANVLATVSADSFVKEGSELNLKNDLQVDFNDLYYFITNGNAYDTYKPSDDVDPIKTSALNISLKNSKAPVINTTYTYSVPTGDICVHNTADFYTSSDRQIVIENIDCTVIPSIVLSEVNSIIG